MKLIWTDDLVLKFAKVSTQGLYGDYKNSKTIKEKLEIFKIINITQKQKTYEKRKNTSTVSNRNSTPTRR